MKKWLKFILMNLILLGLVACGSKTQTQEKDQAADVGKAGEPVKIEYWHPNADTQGGKTVVELVEKFNQSQDEVEVEAVYNDGHYQGLMQNLQLQAASGNPPAIIQVGWSYREYFANNYEFVQPADYGEETYFKEKFPENIYALATSNDGRQVGTPYSLSVPVLYLNMDILNEAGVDPADLTTWEAVRKAANTIVEKTDYKGIYIAEGADNWNVQALVESNGSKVIGTDGKAAFADQAGLDTYQFYQDMITEGACLHTDRNSGIQAFVSGEVGMSHFTIAQRTNFLTNAEFEVVALASPPFEGKEVHLPAGGSMLVVTAVDPDQKAAAYKFLQFLYEPDSIAAWVEGTGYVPPTTDASENKELEKLLNEDPIFTAANSSIKYMVPWAPFPGNSGLEAEQLLIDLRDRVLGGGDVKTDVTACQDEINAMIK